MKKGKYPVLLSIFFLSALLALTGCPDVDSQVGKVTGGGWFEGASGGKASFGFNADSCAAAEGTTKIGVGRFNYHDKYVSGFDGGVKMNGYVTDVCECVEGDGDPSDCEVGIRENFIPPWYELKLSYRSTNPKYGDEILYEAVACVKDDGEGASVVGEGDFAYIEVTQGPYAGYWNKGFVQGNVQSHACDD